MYELIIQSDSAHNHINNKNHSCTHKLERDSEKLIPVYTTYSHLKTDWGKWITIFCMNCTVYCLKSRFGTTWIWVILMIWGLKVERCVGGKTGHFYHLEKWPAKKLISWQTRYVELSTEDTQFESW